MKLDPKKLKKEFNKYYEDNIETATDVFTFSSSQDVIVRHHSPDFKSNYVNGLRFTECRSRDSSHDYNWDDTQFVAVGRDQDTERR